jgi:hypothetical protein
VSLSAAPQAARDLATSPPATRRRSERWRDPRLVVGLVLVTGSALLGATVLGGADQTVPVWAARGQLTEGAEIGTSDLVRRDVRFPADEDARRYVSADAGLAEGTVLLRDVGAGELLPRAAVTTARAATAVEVPLTVAAEAVPATVRPGSVVDVWVTSDPDLVPAVGDEEPANLVFGDVRVLALPRTGGALGPSAMRQVIVGLDRSQERDLPSALTALSRGAVVLVRKS